MRFPQKAHIAFSILINHSTVRSGKRCVIHNQVVGIDIYRLKFVYNYVQKEEGYYATDNADYRFEKDE